jgi:hypothetical protein
MKAWFLRGIPALAGAVALLGSVVAVAAPGAAAAEDIRDIRPLIPIPAWWQGLGLPLAVAAVLVAVVAAYLALRRHGRSELTAEQRAQAALTEAEALARAGRCHEWAELVAVTLRNALAARVGSDVCPRTTGELAAIDWSARPDGALVDSERLLDLLWVCDLTRFALGRLDPESLLASTRSARAWVTHLFKMPEAPEPIPAAVEATP